MISFIVPAHNEELEIPATLDAIHAAASDAGQPYEIIVVDDASTDATPEIASRAGAEVIQINQRQIAAARNAGGKTARGECLFFVDADTRSIGRMWLKPLPPSTQDPRVGALAWRSTDRFRSGDAFYSLRLVHFTLGSTLALAHSFSPHGGISIQLEGLMSNISPEKRSISVSR